MCCVRRHVHAPTHRPWHQTKNNTDVRSTSSELRILRSVLQGEASRLQLYTAVYDFASKPRALVLAARSNHYAHPPYSSVPLYTSNGSFVLRILSPRARTYISAWRVRYFFCAVRETSVGVKACCTLWHQAPPTSRSVCISTYRSLLCARWCYGIMISPIC